MAIVNKGFRASIGLDQTWEGFVKIKHTFCRTLFMGDIKLYQFEHSEQRRNLFWVALHYHIHNELDTLFNTEIKMLEGKTLIQLFIILFGVPAFIYSFFDDVTNWATTLDVWKGVILFAIGAFTGSVVGMRQLVRLIKEMRELKKKSEPKEDDKMKAV